jgi:hypothetical protein
MIRYAIPRCGWKMMKPVRLHILLVLGLAGAVLLGCSSTAALSYVDEPTSDEVLAHTYWRQKGLPTVIVRLFNTVGPRQTGHYGMVVPRLVQQATRGDPVTVYGDGQQTRCFCHVGDVVSALADLMQDKARDTACDTRETAAHPQEAEHAGGQGMTPAREQV